MWPKNSPASPRRRASARAAVRAYKQLKVNERAFRTMKDTIEIRPIHHHLDPRVRAHVFLCTLAYYVAYELNQRLAPLLFTDSTPTAPLDPVAPAQRSPAALRRCWQDHQPYDPTRHGNLNHLLENRG